MSDFSQRPVFAILTGHWLSVIGAILATVTGCAWLLVLPTQLRGHASNPYIGILLFVILPIVFALGLILMPIGVWLTRRRLRRGLGNVLDRQTSLKRLVTFLAVTTMLNIVIISQLTYRAVEHMETTQFCGQSCHVMKPEFTAHRGSSHERVLCVDCHVAPGATGWLESKMSGTRQLIDTVFDRYPRPIRSAIEQNRLVPSSETCEKCHSPEKFSPAKLRVIPEYADDEANTRTQTVLMMTAGGGRLGGIHGKHFGPGISIRYAPADASRQTIPWVEYKNANAQVSRIYLADGTTRDEKTLPRYEMQCIDCHNRPTHTFELPERAMNRAMSVGQIPVSLPFVKKTGLEILKASYSSTEDAAQKIPAAVRNYYQKTYPAIAQARATDIDQAAQSILALYNKNVFPELKVTWGTYTNNIGHTDFPGCFRCHDGAHTSDDKSSITQHCAACHQILAASEASPEVLKTLGLDEQISSAQKK